MKPKEETHVCPLSAILQRAQSRFAFFSRIRLEQVSLISENLEGSASFPQKPLLQKKFEIQVILSI